MVKLIAHRGNINGPNPERENHPDYVDEAISFGFDVEIDLWHVGSIIMLGHDNPVYRIDSSWLRERKDKLWIHAKNLNALEWLNIQSISEAGLLNYFWHEEDHSVLTSNKFVWTHPKVVKVLEGSVVCMPEHNKSIRREQYEKDVLNKAFGVCTDEVLKWKEKIDIMGK